MAYSSYYKSLTQTEKARLQSQVMRINQRYYDIIQTFGVDSRLEQEWRKAIRNFESYDQGKYLNNTKSVLSASRITEKDIKQLKFLESLDTRGERIAENKRMLEKEGETEGLTPKKIRQKAIDWDSFEGDIHKIVMNNKEAIYSWSNTITDALRREGSWEENRLTFKEAMELFKGYHSNWTWHVPEDGTETSY